jgi:Tfp pilus assembly protein PilF
MTIPPASPEIQRADALRKAGQLAEAEPIYQRVLAGSPEDPAALVGLGHVLASRRQFLAAADCFARALEQDRGSDEAQEGLGLALFELGLEQVREAAFADAATTFSNVLEFLPDHADAHHQLAELLLRQGQHPAAILHFERAIALKSDHLEAVLGLAQLHASVNHTLQAIKWYQWALALDPTQEVAHFNLAAMLECEARLAEAQIHRTRTSRPMPLFVESSPSPRRTVLVLWAAGTGNVPVDELMPLGTTTRIKWMVECATDEQEAGLPPHDLVFNAIGNAGVAELAGERLARFCRAHAVLNPPDRVAATRRDLLPATLAGLPGVVVPRVAKIRRDEALESGRIARLFEEGFSLPCIVRPVSCQGGKGALRVDTEAQLREALDSDADASYLIAFHDSRGAEGCFRKYRMIYVDGKPYPYHLAISSGWLVHYQSANMLEAPWKREEERRFMLDPVGTLGRQTHRAIEAIGQRLGLDYAGIDFSVLPDGTVLVFEANATMLVHLRDSKEAFPYKHEVVPTIFRAFEAMLDRRMAESKAGN